MNMKAIFSTAYAEGYIERDPSVSLIRPKASRKEERRQKGLPLSQASFKRKWCELMLAAGCADWREVPEGTSRPGDILKQIQASLCQQVFSRGHDLVKEHS